MANEERASHPAIRSAAKIFAVLNCLSQHGRTMSLGQIAKATGLDKSAVQRCANTLFGLGYFERDESGGLHMSPKCLELGFNFLKSHSLLPRAYPVLFKLHEETGERTNLSLFERTHLIYAIRLPGHREFDFISSLIGRRVPVYSTAGGRAVLARLPDSEVRRILNESKLLPRTSKTKIAPHEIMQQVRLARKRGYAIVLGETVGREIAIGAAVTDEQKRPIGAVHLASTLAWWTAEDYERRFAPLVLKAAESLSMTA